MTAPLRLAYDAGDVASPALRPPKGPEVPTLIGPLPHKPQCFADLNAMARHIHGLRGEKGIEIGKLTFAAYGVSETFPGFNLSLVDNETGQSDWVGFIAIQSETPDRLKAALEKTRERAA